MDNIWDRKVGGHWPLWRGWKTEWHAEPTKSQKLKKIIFKKYKKSYHTLWIMIYLLLVVDYLCYIFPVTGVSAVLQWCDCTPLLTACLDLSGSKVTATSLTHSIRQKETNSTKIASTFSIIFLLNTCLRNSDFFI